MSHQASPKTPPVETPQELQNEAQSLPMPQSEAEKPESQQLIQLADNDKERAFAHDINFKIDNLEGNIDSLAKQYRVSEDRFRQAIGDIRSRTALVTDEISQFTEQMLKGDIKNETLIAAVEARLKGAVGKLQGELTGLYTQVTSQQSTVESLQGELNQSFGELESRIALLEQGLSARIAEIDLKQNEQARTQHIFSDLLEKLKKHGDETADELYATQVNNIEQQRINRKVFFVSGGVFAGLLLMVMGVMAYLHWNSDVRTSALVADQVSTQWESKLTSFSNDLDGRYAGRDEVQSQLKAADSRSSALATRLAEASVQADRSLASANETLQELSEKIASLQLSVYGPDDSADVIPSPQITLNDKDRIMDQNPVHYSIQLVGVYRERSMMNFVNQFSKELSEYPVAFNVSQYRGQDWYNVIYGSFASFQEAQSVLDSLPRSLQNNAPWIRQMGSIQRTGIQ